jgi:hypothetical protein
MVNRKTPRHGAAMGNGRIILHRRYRTEKNTGIPRNIVNLPPHHAFDVAGLRDDSVTMAASIAKSAQAAMKKNISRA